MRLFKRRTLAQSPELVSATPISQEINGNAAFDDDDDDCMAVRPATSMRSRSRKSDLDEIRAYAAPAVTMLATPKRTGGAKTPAQTATPSSGLKTLTTWSRRVGEKWDQLKKTESSEKLSSSARRRCYSPHKKDNDAKKTPKTACATGCDFAKPKRISRVESLRNLFKSATSSASKKSLSIKEEEEEEEVDAELDSPYRMEKSLSEGALKSHRGGPPLLNELESKKWQISQSIQDLEQRSRVLDYFLEHQELLSTREGKVLARKTVQAVADRQRPFSSVLMMEHRQRRDSDDSSEHLDYAAGASDSPPLDGVKKDLFNARARADEDKSGPLRNVVTGLEDLMSGLRLGCDESGYDSDSTRAGADSPDSEKSVTAPIYRRSLADYTGIDLSMSFLATPKRPQLVRGKSEENDSVAAATNKSADEHHFECNEEQDEDEQAETTIVEDPDVFNDTANTDTTLIVSDNEDDEVAKTESTASMRLSRLRSTDSGVGTMEAVQMRTPERKKSFKEPTRSAPKSKLSGLQKTLKVCRKASNVSLMNLVENAASPSKESPPLFKGIVESAKSRLQYYNPKRTRSAIEPETPAVTSSKLKRSTITPQPMAKVASSLSTARSSLTRRELKTLKLEVARAGDLGISVQKCNTARPYFVISEMEENGAAAKSKLFKVGDEVVRVSGRRLRGMSLMEAKNALKRCSGNVEMQISREPSLFEGSDLWSGSEKVVIRSKSDTDAWGPMLINPATVEMKFDSPGSWTTTDADDAIESTPRVAASGSNKRKNCEIIGAVRKDGRTVSVQDMEGVDSDEHKVTGMKKFHIRKRSSTLSAGSHRATSLSMDLLTVSLEKGAPKRLGFTIVGGSDSRKGPMGIFVKDILAGGQAAEEGTLRVEDEILAINGKPLDGMTHEQARQLFKTAKRGKLILHVGRRDPLHKRPIAALRQAIAAEQ